MKLSEFPFRCSYFSLIFPLCVIIIVLVLLFLSQSCHEVIIFLQPKLIFSLLPM